MVVRPSSHMEWEGYHPATLSIVIETDASLLGWGVVCNGVQTGGLWSREEQLEHINVLKLRASMFEVQAFTKDKQKVSEWTIHQPYPM